MEEPYMLDNQLIRAVEKNDIAFADSLLSNGANIESMNYDGHTPLMIASHIGYEDLVSMLIKHKANINALGSEDNDMSAIMFAAKNGHAGIVKLLLSSGADIETKSRWGSPLLFAAGCNRIEVIALLLDSGANPYTKNEDGLTAIDLAEHYKHHDAANFIMAWIDNNLLSSRIDGMDNQSTLSF